MSVRQSGMPATDEDIKRASIDGAAKRIVWQQPRNQTDAIACRLYPSLSFFFDGTNNNLERDQPINKHSNIAKLFQAAVVRRRYEAKPIYLPGVGTPFRFEKVVGYTDHLKDDDGGVFGLGLGAGGDLRIKFALGEFSRLLEVEFGPGSWRHMREITVAIFGFSRGATEARAFARGLVTQKCLKDDGGLYWRAPNLVRVPLRINFMGIFDTVASVGGPALHLDWASELAIPVEVERCVHYVAAHEVRRAFPLDSVRIDTSYQNNCEEIVYPGVHSDVGGGYAPDEQGRDKDLSFISLRHMFIEALRAGVPLMSLDEMPSRPLKYLDRFVTI